VHLPVGTEEQHENLSEHWVCQPKCESWTVQIRSRIAQSSTAMFDVLWRKDNVGCHAPTFPTISLPSLETWGLVLFPGRCALYGVEIMSPGFGGLLCLCLQVKNKKAETVRLFSSFGPVTWGWNEYSLCGSGPTESVTCSRLAL